MERTIRVTGKGNMTEHLKQMYFQKHLGVSLGEIVTIDYSWAEIDFVSRPMDKLMLEECCRRICEPDEAYDIDINPDDIDVTDNVMVVWGIK